MMVIGPTLLSTENEWQICTKRSPIRAKFSLSLSLMQPYCLMKDALSLIGLRPRLYRIYIV